MASYALVTGASAGIGTVFAREIRRAFPELGLILVARRENRLRALESELGGDIILLPADLGDDTSRKALLDEIDRLGLSVELLVNNAGFGSLGPFSESDPDTQGRMVAVNCRAPVELARRLLPGMLSRGRGDIVNVCSTAAFIPLPYMATYAATKAFLLSFSAALSAELAGSGVRVLALCPGPTESEFHIAAGLPTKLDVLHAMTAEEVVLEALSGLKRRKSIVVNGWLNAILARAGRLIPLSLAARIAKLLLKKYLPKR